jgi:hypothetical protein
MARTRDRFATSVTLSAESAPRRVGMPRTGCPGSELPGPRHAGELRRPCRTRVNR